MHSSYAALSPDTQQRNSAPRLSEAATTFMRMACRLPLLSSLPFVIEKPAGDTPVATVRVISARAKLRSFRSAGRRARDPRTATVSIGHS
jgi:hypothetical protein